MVNMDHLGICSSFFQSIGINLSDQSKVQALWQYMLCVQVVFVKAKDNTDCL